MVPVGGLPGVRQSSEILKGTTKRYQNLVLWVCQQAQIQEKTSPFSTM